MTVSMEFLLCMTVVQWAREDTAVLMEFQSGSWLLLLVVLVSDGQSHD